MIFNEGISIYIDGILKDSNPSFFEEIKKISEQRLYTYTVSLDSSDQINNPSLIFIDQESIAGLERVSRHDFIVMIKNNNLNFFSQIEVSEHLFTINDVEELKQVFLLFDDYHSEYINSIIQQQLRSTKAYLKKNIESKFLNDLSDEDINKLKKIQNLTYTVSGLNEIQEIVNKQFPRTDKAGLLLLTKKELLSFDFSGKGIIELSITKSESIYLSFDLSSDILSFVFSLQSIVEERVQLLRGVFLNQGKQEVWSERFQKIPFPIVLFTPELQLIVHNSLFPDLKLSSQECAQIQSDDIIKVNKKKFHVIKKSLKNNYLFFFIPVNIGASEFESSSTEELGIVSSSIAHELNNPLAGILAALEVLLLDDYEDEITEKFTEMKGGVERCKKLVETFLGFSRLSAESFGVDNDPHYIKESAAQAVELVRFRIIENNLKFNSTYELQSVFRGQCNPHVLTMLLYLAFGELLTTSSHLNLVKNSGEGANPLSIKVVESTDRILLETNISIDKTAIFWKSKLFNHLLHDENLAISFEGKNINFQRL